MTGIDMAAMNQLIRDGTHVRSRRNSLQPSLLRSSLRLRYAGFSLIGRRVWRHLHPPGR